MTNNENNSAQDILDTAKEMLQYIPDYYKSVKDGIKNLTTDSPCFDRLILAVSCQCSIYEKKETSYKLLHYLADEKKNGDACYILACNRYKDSANNDEQNTNYQKYMKLAGQYGSKLLKETLSAKTLASSSTAIIHNDEKRLQTSNLQHIYAQGKESWLGKAAITTRFHGIFCSKKPALAINFNGPQKWQEEKLSEEEYNSMNNSL